MAEAKEIGFSAFEVEALVSRLAAARNVIDAKHASYTEKPEAERLPDMTLEAPYKSYQSDGNTGIWCNFG